MVTLDYLISLKDVNLGKNHEKKEEVSEFRLSYYPHKLEVFTNFLNVAFNNKAKHTIYADFQPLDQAKDPGFYIHVLEK